MDKKEMKRKQGGKDDSYSVSIIKLIFFYSTLSFFSPPLVCVLHSLSSLVSVPATLDSLFLPARPPSAPLSLPSFHFNPSSCISLSLSIRLCVPCHSPCCPRLRHMALSLCYCHPLTQLSVGITDTQRNMRGCALASDVRGRTRLGKLSGVKRARK